MSIVLMSRSGQGCKAQPNPDFGGKGNSTRALATASPALYRDSVFTPKSCDKKTLTLGDFLCKSDRLEVVHSTFVWTTFMKVSMRKPAQGVVQF